MRCVIKQVTRRLRQYWANTRIVWSDDNRYACFEAMEWAEADGAGYIFRLAGNAALDSLAAETADTLCFHTSEKRMPFAQRGPVY